MLRKIITIDEVLCNGCGLCVDACHEGAIGLVDGKARLLRDDYCDGLGDCLPACPTGAIRFEEREADAYDEEAVQKKKKSRLSSEQASAKQDTLPCGCPGTRAKTMERENPSAPVAAAVPQTSQLRQWPVQLKLVPANAAYLNGAHLLVAADCAAYACGNFHADYMKNRITLIGCPKLDEGDYSEKLTAMLRDNEIKSVTAVRMEVPCCGGIEAAVKKALSACGKLIPWQAVTLSTDGKALEN